MYNLGKNIIHYKEIDSTQKEVWRRIENNNIESGTLIIADRQTQGIGTHGRTWYADENGSIIFSFPVFLDTRICNLDNFTIEIAISIVEVFEQLYKIKLDIKKPNDLMIKGKKVGGILTQTKVQGENVKNIVIGIGINTNKIVFEKEIKDIATSIKNEFDIDVDNKKVITEFCKNFEIKIRSVL